MTSLPLVSILIPCHNAAPWLAETVQSSLAQTWPQKEIIVVDDGSTDESARIARSFSSHGVHVVEQPNRGASAARNAAIAASRGEWLQYLDADDLLDAQKIESQLRVAAAIGDEYAICGRWARFVGDLSHARYVDEPLCRDTDAVDWVRVKLGTGAMMHPAAWLVSRRLAANAGLWNESLSLDDDGEYFTRVVLQSKGVRCCEAALSYYRSAVTGSLSARRTRGAWDSALTSQRLCAEHLLARADTPEIRRACANQFQRLAYQIYPDCPDLVAACEKEAQRHGGADNHPDGGKIFNGFARIFGWKAAKRLQQWRTRA